MKQYRITFRSEIYLQAEDEEDAERKFENADLQDAGFVGLCDIEEDDE